MKVAINGFGRIGRQAFKALHDFHSKIDVVAVNDLTDTKTLAHLLKYDSNYGIFDADIKASENAIFVDKKEIKVLSEKEPAKLPWSKLGIDLVIESTGFFTDGNLARDHIKAGAKKVIISAPAKNQDITIALGVNQDLYDANKHNIISMASCTTNCLAPMVKVLFDEFGIKHGFMTTIHSYTNDQQILDLPHKDIRRARAAALNIIPTSTGAAKAIFELIPELKGKIDGMAFRVPTPTVSIVDLVIDTEKKTDVDGVNNVFKKAASGKMKGVLATSSESLVSMDYKGNTHSSIIDLELTKVIGDNLVKTVSWYDNEWGYSCRIADLVSYISNTN